MLENKNFERFFHSSYEKCRSIFLGSITLLKYKCSSVTHKELKVSSKTDDNLFIDTLHIKTKEDNKNLVIISSGIHGMEGFTGSALQSILIDDLLKDGKKYSNLDFLFIHAVNPWGFKNKRRVNENNVDLNRNFGTTNELFAIKNKSYALLNSLLNPPQKISTNFFSVFYFVLKMLFYAIARSKRFVVEAVGVGQYEFEKGIVFGGFRFQEEKEILHPVIESIVVHYKKIVAIDLHTGLGKRGELYILNAPNSDKKIKKLANHLFNESVVDDDNENFYNEHGAFLDFISSLKPNGQTCVPAMFEFGTINTHTLKGSLKLLINTRFENQGFHYGYKRTKDKEKIKKEYHEMFYPSSNGWRTKVISSFFENISLIASNIDKIDC